MQKQSCFLRRVTAAIILLIAAWGIPAKSQSAPDPSANNLVMPARPYTIPLYWQGDTVNNRWEPHTAILIPVRLKNCPKRFFMQFDTGSPYSLFYRNKLAAIQEMYPKAMQLGESGSKLMNFSFTAGSMPVLAKEIEVKLFDSSTVNWKDKKSIEIIGTLGADFIDGRAIMIDYPEKKLTISQFISPKLSARLSLTDFVYAGKRILLPAKVEGKETMLYFDTGSSMYELLTDKKTCEALAAPGSEFIQSKVRSWDKYLTAVSIASNAGIEMSGILIPVHYVTYVEGVSSSRAEQMRKMGIGGMTGNKIFTGCTLVLDTKNKKFAIIPKK